MCHNPLGLSQHASLCYKLIHLHLPSLQSNQGRRGEGPHIVNDSLLIFISISLIQVKMRSLLLALVCLAVASAAEEFVPHKDRKYKPRIG